MIWIVKGENRRPQDPSLQLVNYKKNSQQKNGKDSMSSRISKTKYIDYFLSKILYFEKKDASG